MGQTTFPCPTCGQVQRVEHENGTEVTLRLCAACDQLRQEEKLDQAAFVKKHRH